MVGSIPHQFVKNKSRNALNQKCLHCLERIPLSTQKLPNKTHKQSTRKVSMATNKKNAIQRRENMIENDAVTHSHQPITSNALKIM